jgi:hypothetical protein
MIDGSGNGHTHIRVTDTLYLGDRVRISGLTPNGQPLALEAHNSTRLDPDSMLAVRLDEHHIHLLQ